MMNKLAKCDICEYRDNDKKKMPCASCNQNKLFKSHFKADKIVRVLMEAWDISEEDMGPQSHDEA